MLQVKDVMSREVLTTTEETDIHSLARMLTEHRISGAPVLNEKGKLVGVVSLHDLVARQGRVGDTEVAGYWNATQNLEKGFNVQDMSRSLVKVKDVMTPAIHSIAPDAPLSEVCDYLTKGQIHRVLVTQEDKLEGIVTGSDLIGVLKSLLPADEKT